MGWPGSRPDSPRERKQGVGPANPGGGSTGGGGRLTPRPLQDPLSGKVSGNNYKSAGCPKSCATTWTPRAGLDEIKNRRRFPGHAVARHGDGVRQRRLVSHHLDASTKLRMSAQALSRSRCPSWHASPDDDLRVSRPNVEPDND